MEPKYKLGDTAFFMYSNKVCEGQINGIFQTCDILQSEVKNIHIEYSVYNPLSSYNNRFGEEKIFPTKEELLASL